MEVRNENVLPLTKGKANQAQMTGLHLANRTIGINSNPYPEALPLDAITLQPCTQ
jgi:hypothetical protein